MHFILPFPLENVKPKPSTEKSYFFNFFHIFYHFSPIYVIIPSLTVGKIKNGYKPSKHGLCSRFSFRNDMCYIMILYLISGKIQSFLKKRFMRKRIWIHRCMYSRKIILLLLPMKLIRNFWQKSWQIRRCKRCLTHWQRR